MSTLTDVTLADLSLFADGAPWQVFDSPVVGFMP